VARYQQRLLLVIFLSSVAVAAFAASAAPGGAVSLVQQTAKGYSTATNPSGTFASSQADGDANVIVFEYCGKPGGSGGGDDCINSPGPASSVTDTAGNTYTRICGPLTTISGGSYTTDCGGGSPIQDHYTVTVEIWFSASIKAASAGNVVTANMPAVGNMSGWNIWMFQLHPASGTVVFDQYVSKETGTLADPIGGPISTGTTAITAYPNEFFFAYCSTSNGTCPPALNVPTWTEVGLNGSTYYDTHSDAAYKIVGSVQTATESFTAGSGDNEWLGLLVTFGSAVLPAPPTSVKAVVTSNQY
jgi:hypothetical protein